MKAKDKTIAGRRAPVLHGEYPNYKTQAGDTIRVVSVFCGDKPASKLIHDAAVKKILYEGRS